MLPGTENFIVDQVRLTGCSRNWHIAGGKRGVLIYVIMNINYNQVISKGGLQKVTSVLAWVQFAGYTVVTSWNSASSTFLQIFSSS